MSRPCATSVSSSVCVLITSLSISTPSQSRITRSKARDKMRYPAMRRLAAARASSVTSLPASMRAISSRRAVPLIGFTCVVDPLAASARSALVMRKMRAGLRRDLRRMRDGEHLHALGEPREPPADRLGDGAAGAGIDLVEDQRRRGAAIGERHLQRQQEARQLAARRDLHQRPGLGAGIGADVEGDPVEAVRRDRALVDLARDDEARRLKLQRRQLGVDRLLQRRRGLGAALGQRLRGAAR